MIEIENLTVRFGGVTPIDGVSVVFESGTCGLIGPNGAGKTTFFNVMSGFVKPAAGSITAFGENLLKMADYRRARWGLRRTFQTEMAIEKLSDLRQRGDDPRALGREARLAPRRRPRRDRVRRPDRRPPKAKVGTPRRARAPARRDRPRRRRQPAARAARRARGRASRTRRPATWPR